MRRRGLIGGTVVALLLLSLAFGCIFAAMLWAVGDQREAARQAQASEDRVAAVLLHQKLVLDLEVGVRGYQITGERRFLEPYFAARDAIPGNFTRIQRELGAEPAHRRRLFEIQRNVDSYVTNFADPLVRGSGAASQSDRVLTTAEGKRRIDALRLKFKAFIDNEFRQSRDAAQLAEARATNAKRMGALGLAASVLLVLLYGVYQVRAVLRPIKRVAGATERLGDGDLTVRVPSLGSGEVNALARGFNSMAVSLEYTRDELEAQNAELQAQQTELEAAVAELAEKKSRIERFHAFGARLASEAELQPLAAAILNEMADMVDAEVGELHAFGEGDPDYAVKLAVRGLATDDHPSIRRGEGLAGRAIAELRPVTASHGETGMVVPALGDNIAVRHELHVPLIHAGRLVGILSLARVDDLPFSNPELELIESLAERASVGLANAVLLQEARRQASITSAVLATAADGFISIDEDGLVIEWNARSEEMFGWTREEVVGRPLSASIVPERYRGAHESGVRRFAVTGESHLAGREVELVAVHRDGREFPISLTMSPLPLDGRMVVNAFVRDISERKRAEVYAGVQHAVTRVLSEAETLDEARAGVLEAIGTGLGLEFGASWALGVEGTAQHGRVARRRQPARALRRRHTGGTAHPWRGPARARVGTEPGDLDRRCRGRPHAGARSGRRRGRAEQRDRVPGGERRPPDRRGRVLQRLPPAAGPRAALGAQHRGQPDRPVHRAQARGSRGGTAQGRVLRARLARAAHAAHLDHRVPRAGARGRQGRPATRAASSRSSRATPSASCGSSAISSSWPRSRPATSRSTRAPSTSPPPPPSPWRPPARAPRSSRSSCVLDADRIRTRAATPAASDRRSTTSSRTRSSSRPPAAAWRCASGATERRRCSRSPTPASASPTRTRRACSSASSAPPPPPRAPSRASAWGSRS